MAAKSKPVKAVKAAKNKKARPMPIDLPTMTQIMEHLQTQDEHLRAQDAVLEKLQNRLDHARVMNGGFDNLMVKVEKIDSIQLELKNAVTNLQTGQAGLGKKLDDVHAAVYDPEKGLYEKVKGALKWIKTANWFLKGVAGVMGAGMLTGMGKLLYDIFTGHIHYSP